MGRTGPQDEYERVGCMTACYEGCCCCISRHMTLNKCCSLIPVWPLMALALFIGAAITLLLGLDLVTSSIGITVSPVVANTTWIAMAAVLILNLVFSYSVVSNKMRIHNVHCNAEGCRGYQIKNARMSSNSTTL